MSEVRVDPLEFDAWVEGLEKPDLLHAFVALKTLELMRFKKTVGEDYEEVLDNWTSLK